eukprot:8492232-Pyramimonas_sp.AAC.1
MASALASDIVVGQPLRKLAATCATEPSPPTPSPTLSLSLSLYLSLSILYPSLYPSSRAPQNLLVKRSRERRRRAAMPTSCPSWPSP